MSNFKNYLQLIQESNQHVINEEPITGILSVLLFYILGTIINPNPGHPLYNKETATVEEIKKIEKEAPKIIESIDNPELTKAFKAELTELRAKKAQLKEQEAQLKEQEAKMEKEEQDLVANYNKKQNDELFAKNKNDFPTGDSANVFSNNKITPNSYRQSTSPTSSKR